MAHGPSTPGCGAPIVISMPRSHRLELAGGIFHITARGNRKHDIFVDDGDRHIFLHLFAATVGHCGWRCHAYCLMPNHFHLVIETLEANLSAGMQRLNGTYAQWFNHRHGLCGHVFQGRFHSTLVENDAHLLELSRYIVLNPTRAGLCLDPTEWTWSSLSATLGRITAPGFLTVDWLLSQFGHDTERARTVYEDFVRYAMPPSRR